MDKIFSDIVVAIIVVGYIFFKYKSDKSTQGRKKKPVPTASQTNKQPKRQPQKDIGFEIPSIKGAPEEHRPKGRTAAESAKDAAVIIKVPGQDAGISHKTASTYNDYLARCGQPTAAGQEAEQAFPVNTEHVVSRKPVSLQREALARAVAYAEILGRPRAYEKHSPYARRW